MSAKKPNKGWIALNFSANAPTVDEKPGKNPKAVVKKNARPSKRGPGNLKLFEKLEPDKMEDLAVHSNKIKEVEEWLRCNVMRAEKLKNTSMLLITGPTGSGKTATLKVLCKTMKIDVQEWINPTDWDHEGHKGPGQVLKFTDFLIEAKFPSLLGDCNDNKKITLIEDFPNALFDNPKEFDSILDTCVSNGNTAIVFICTEVNNNNSLNMARHLFTQELKDKYSITTISFNACSATLLKSALNRVHSFVKENGEALEVPSMATKDAIVASAMGDIRCAINQYYFACLPGAGALPTEAAPTEQQTVGTGRKRKRPKISTVKSMIKDETLGLFHGLGRVLNPKRVETGSSWRLRCDLVGLIDEFSAQPATFNAFLQENYPKYFGDVGDLARASDALSLSQTLMERWAGHHETHIIALWISVMGLMVHNEHRVSRWTPITKPRKFGQTVDCNRRPDGVRAVDYYYYNIITGSDKYPKFKHTK